MAVAGGEITVGPAVPNASVAATISAASFSTSNRARDRDIRSPRLVAGATTHWVDVVFSRGGALCTAGRRAAALPGTWARAIVVHMIAVTVGTAAARTDGPALPCQERRGQRPARRVVWATAAVPPRAVAGLFCARPCAGSGHWCGVLSRGGLT